jgi:hypothetical protein
MDNGMIGKIEKAKRYAEERTRIHFESSGRRSTGRTTGIASSSATARGK